MILLLRVSVCGARRRARPPADDVAADRPGGRSARREYATAIVTAEGDDARLLRGPERPMLSMGPNRPSERPDDVRDLSPDLTLRWSRTGASPAIPPVGGIEGRENRAAIEQQAEIVPRCTRPAGILGLTAQVNST